MRECGVLLARCDITHQENTWQCEINISAASSREMSWPRPIRSCGCTRCTSDCGRQLSYIDLGMYAYAIHNKLHLFYI